MKKKAFFESLVHRGPELEEFARRLRGTVARFRMGCGGTAAVTGRASGILSAPWRTPKKETFFDTVQLIYVGINGAKSAGQPPRFLGCDVACGCGRRVSHAFHMNSLMGCVGILHEV